MRSLGKKTAMLTPAAVVLALGLVVANNDGWAEEDSPSPPEPPDAAVPEVAPAAPDALSVPEATPPKTTAPTQPVAASREDFDDLEAALSESIVSTASKTAESLTNAPATMTTITAEDLRSHGITNLQDALQYLAIGIFVQEPIQTMNEVGASGVIFTDDYLGHLLVLLDGHVMNEQWSGTVYIDRGAGLPIWAIDHIEVMLGPSSVLYGTNAMLGVINVVTKRIKDAPVLHVGIDNWLAPGVSRDGKARASGFGHEALLSLGVGRPFQLAGRPGEVLLALQYDRLKGQSYSFPAQSYGDDASSGAPKNFGPDTPPGVWGGTTTSRSYWADVPSGYAHVSWADFDLYIRGSYYKRAWPTQFGDFNSGNTWELDRSFSTDLRHHAYLGPIELRSRLYTDLQLYRQFIDDSGAEDCPVLATPTNGCYYTVTGRAKSVALEEQLSHDLLGDGRFTALFGADGRVRAVSSDTVYEDRVTGERPDVSSGDYAHTEKSLGVYLQETAKPIDRLTLNLGARLDWEQRFGTALSPRAAVITNPWRGGTAKLIYAEAFRAPTGFEAYWSDPGYAIAPTNLRPEKVRNLELSAAQKLGTTRVFASGFTSWWTDMVSWHTLTPSELQAAIEAGKLAEGTGSGGRYANLGKLRSSGIHVGVDGSTRAPRLRYALTATLATTSYEDREVTVTDSAGNNHPASHRLVLAPRIYGKGSIARDFLDGKHTVGVTAIYMGSAPSNKAYGGSWDPVVPMSSPQAKLRLSASGEIPGVPNLSYQASATFSLYRFGTYHYGPVTYPNPPDQPSPVLSPNEPMRFFLGLRYDFK